MATKLTPAQQALFTAIYTAAKGDIIKVSSARTLEALQARGLVDCSAALDNPRWLQKAYLGENLGTTSLRSINSGAISNGVAITEAGQAYAKAIGLAGELDYCYPELPPTPAPTEPTAKPAKTFATPRYPLADTSTPAKAKQVKAKLLAQLKAEANNWRESDQSLASAMVSLLEATIDYVNAGVYERITLQTAIDWDDPDGDEFVTVAPQLAMTWLEAWLKYYATFPTPRPDKSGASIDTTAQEESNRMNVMVKVHWGIDIIPQTLPFDDVASACQWLASSGFDLRVGPFLVDMEPRNGKPLPKKVYARASCFINNSKATANGIQSAVLYELLGTSPALEIAESLTQAPRPAWLWTFVSGAIGYNVYYFPQLAKAVVISTAGGTVPLEMGDVELAEWLLNFYDYQQLLNIIGGSND